MSKNIHESTDIAIIGGGPAGMQAALVASRARKRVVVFDEPAPPRNGASRGVHNFLGLDGMLPQEIRDIAWKQINDYQYAELRKERVVDFRRSGDGRFLIRGADGTELETAKVVLAVGYYDVYPDVAGFIDCWASTIIQCPFCDGYENSGRIWGIVPSSDYQLKNYPKMAMNWTSEVNVLIPPGIEIEPAYREELYDLNIKFYEGTISKIDHSEGKLEAVTLDSGERVKVETLMWTPPRQPSQLIHNLVENIGVAINDTGNVITDEMQRTNVSGLWAAGEVSKCCSNALDSAAAGSRAAKSIIRSWSLKNHNKSEPYVRNERSFRLLNGRKDKLKYESEKIQTLYAHCKAGIQK